MRMAESPSDCDWFFRVRCLERSSNLAIWVHTYRCRCVYVCACLSPFQLGLSDTQRKAIILRVPVFSHAYTSAPIAILCQSGEKKTFNHTSAPIPILCPSERKKQQQLSMRSSHLPTKSGWIHLVASGPRASPTSNERKRGGLGWATIGSVSTWGTPKSPKSPKSK